MGRGVIARSPLSAILASLAGAPSALSVALAIVVAVMWCPGVVLGATVGTGTVVVECDYGATLCCSSVTFDDASYDVFGTPVNLGTTGGVTGTSETVLSDFTGTSGNFASHTQSTNLSYDVAGSFICGASGCLSGPVSFVGSISNLVDSIGLPAADYTQDGTIQYTGTTTTPSSPGCPLVGVNVLQGPLAINAFQPVDTPAGSDLTVSSSTTFFDSSTAAETAVTIDVTYAGVVAPGTTAVTAFSNAAGNLTANFAADFNGYHAAFADVSTSATITGPITVCSTYPDVNRDGIVDGTEGSAQPLSACDLRLLHEEAGTFVDRTPNLGDPSCPLHPVAPCPAQQCLDPAQALVCATVDSLSTFVVAAFEPPPVITAGAEAGSTRVFGQGAANVPALQLEIWSAGANRIPESGANDDELLGAGGTDAAGNFQSSPGIGLSRPLLAGERIFAIDRQHNRIGPAVAVSGATAPALGRWGTLSAVLALFAVAWWSVRRPVRPA